MSEGRSPLLPLAPGHTRGDCVGGERPCSWQCRYRLADGSCSLDVADSGSHTLEEVGNLLGLTHERIRQIEVIALGKLRKRFVAQG